MSNKKISQTQARAWRKELNALKEQRRLELNSWRGEWPGGRFLAQQNHFLAQQNHTAPTAHLPAVIRTAQRLDAVVVCTADDYGMVRFFGVKR
jgi:hypothetical protein